MNRRSLMTFGGLALLAGFSQAAFAHPGHPVSGFVGGATHPISGLDHILAMLAVGIWAAQLGGRALWMVPCAFVALMAGGGMMGIAGVPIPFVESGIAVSVLVLGLMIATAMKAPLSISIPLVGFFALFHGHAHGAELGSGMSAFGYSIGFLLATAALHGTGILLAIGTKRLLSAPLVFRATGAAISVCGLFLLTGWIKA